MTVTFTGEYKKIIVKNGKKKKIKYVENPIFLDIGKLTISEKLFYELFESYDSNSGNQYINELKDYVFSNVQVTYESINSFIGAVKTLGEKIQDKSLKYEYHNFISFLECGYIKIGESELNKQLVILEFIGES